MHDHTCPDCGLDFACEVPFCLGVRRVACDGCLDTTTKIVPHSDGYQQVVDYVRGREAGETRPHGGRR